MAYFQHVRTRFDGPEGYTLGINGLAVQSGSGAGRLYSANGQQGGLLVRDPGQSLAVTQQQSFAAISGRATAAALEIVMLGGREALISFGQGPGLWGYWLEADGAIGGGFTLPIASTTTVLAVQTLALADGRDMLFVSSLQSLGVTAWLREADGSLTQHQQLAGVDGVQGYDVLAMAITHVAGQALLVSVAAQGNSVSCYRLDAMGRAVLAECLGPAEGLAIAAPNLVQTVHLAGRDFVLLGSAGSGSVTVLDLATDGQMRVLDQVNDDLNTRFQGISVLETVTVSGRVFVLAAGADDGLSLMTLLPNGRLLHLETLADSLTTALQDVSALSLRANGDGIDVFVTGLSEAALSQFRIDPGPLAPILICADTGETLSGDARGDLILGGAGKDRLYGGDGADILIDGTGVDALYGGAGADVFVFLPDGDRDEIRDFTLGSDRLDLSGLGRIYARYAINFVAMEGGIELRVLGEKIQLFSSTGQIITPDQITDAMLFDLAHVGPAILPDVSREIIGTTQADMLLGKSANDTLYGGAGDDQLTGGLGNDLISGGVGQDMACYQGAQSAVINLRLTRAQNTGYGYDLLSGIEDICTGGGNDWLYGTVLGNRLDAGAGNDTVSGGLGNDTVYGGDGDDRLSGGPGHDVIEGGAGHDVARFSGTEAVTLSLAVVTTQNTGQGYDRLEGVEDVWSGAGSDWLRGNDQGNLFSAGAGRDTLLGDAGDDTLYGGGDDDQLTGGFGNDVIIGGTGRDVAYFMGALDAVVTLTKIGVQDTGYGLDRLRGIEDICTDTGNDWLLGTIQANLLSAGAGNDTLSGGVGNDTLLGGSGDDRLTGGYGNDMIEGGAGRDMAAFLGARSVVVDLDLTTAQNTGYGFDQLAGIEDVSAGNGNDWLGGNDQGNMLSAGSGRDSLAGGLGNDSLYGGIGTDWLAGGAGNNLLSGGAGADTFVFIAAEGGIQRVTDIERADYIRLQGFGYASATEALSHMTQSGGDVIFVDQGVTLIFAAAPLGRFSAEMFLV